MDDEIDVKEKVADENYMVENDTGEYDVEEILTDEYD